MDDQIIVSLQLLHQNSIHRVFILNWELLLDSFDLKLLRQILKHIFTFMKNLALQRLGSTRGVSWQKLQQSGHSLRGLLLAHCYVGIDMQTENFRRIIKRKIIIDKLSVSLKVHFLRTEVSIIRRVLKSWFQGLLIHKLT